MKLTSYFAGCAVFLIGVEASSHIKKNEHRALLQRKRSQHSSRGLKINGLIKANDGSCGSNGATHDITATAGPNGSLDWLNCGVNKNGGWNPPYVAVDDIVSTDLNDALKDPNSPFQPCANYAWAFEQASQKYNIPSIMLASFALQESSCNKEAVGGAGEQGLMQLTQDKCVDAPGGNCKDVGFNVKAGAKLFSNLLKDNGGNILIAIGSYNGWKKGMTVGEATAAGDGANCRWQNNLDYIFQYLNGWILNIDAYNHSPRLGKYFNLDRCGN